MHILSCCLRTAGRSFKQEWEEGRGERKQIENSDHWPQSVVILFPNFPLKPRDFVPNISNSGVVVVLVLFSAMTGAPCTDDVNREISLKLLIPALPAERWQRIE